MKPHVESRKCRHAVWALAAMAALILGRSNFAQPPGRGGGPPPPRAGGPRGGAQPPPSALERAVENLNFAPGKATALASAVRSYQNDLRQLSDLALPDLQLKMKSVLAPDDFVKFKNSTDALRGGGGTPLTPDSVVERILSFDPSGSGKVKKENLPERMQYLIDQGDANKDGVLDREEIRNMTIEASVVAEENGRGAGGRGGRGGRGGPGGPGGRGGRGNGGRGGAVSESSIDQALTDLKLAPNVQQAAGALVKYHEENVKRLSDLAKSGLMLTAGEILTPDELRKFADVVATAPADPPGRRGGPGGGGPGPGRGGPPGGRSGPRGGFFPPRPNS